MISVAKDLALQAGHHIQILRQSPLIKERKTDYSVVTNGDHAADDIIRGGLQKAFPTHSILTEESGLTGSPDAEYLWVIDPIDGTRAYVKGVPGYSVMIGLMKEGNPILGVVFDPLEDVLYEALKGEGTFCTIKGQKERVQVSSRENLRDMVTITSTGFPSQTETELKVKLPGPWIPAVNSVGVKIGYMTRRLADIYINHHSVHYWDLCGPQVILEEAGGKISYLDGQAIRYPMQGGSYRFRGSTLATNGNHHSKILKILETLTPRLA